MPKNGYEVMEERLTRFRADQYVTAFNRGKHKITDKQRQMLCIHCEARTITATQLGKAVGYSYRGVNSQYGRLAHLVGERLGLAKMPWVPIRPHHVAGGWQNVLAKPTHAGPEWESTMRPNVLKAQRQIGWCDETRERIPSDRPSSGAEPPSGGVGGGFGNAEQNARVEQAAMFAVKRDYRSRGWTVQSREAEKLGYDLQCSRGSAVHHVEVKGVSGPDCSFEVTAKRRGRQQGLTAHSGSSR